MSAEERKMSQEQTTNDVPSESESESLVVDPISGDGPSQSDPAPPWRDFVKPYLLNLASKVSEQGPKRHSIPIRIGRFNILVSPLDQRLVLRFAEGYQPEHTHHALILDAMGMSLLIAVIQRKIEKPQNADNLDLQRRLEEGRQLAYRLGHTMTAETRRLRGEGLGEAAAEVRTAKNHLVAIIEEIENAGQYDRPEPEKKPEPKKEPDHQRFVYQWDSSGASSSTSGPPVTATHARATTKTTGKPTGRQRLILTVLAIVFAVILNNLWLHRSRQLRDFSVEDFPKVPGIEQVINRSPTLLIIVSQKQWAAADTFQKEEGVTTVVDTIRPAGYRFAQFRSQSDPDLASWNKNDDKIIIEK